MDGEGRKAENAAAPIDASGLLTTPPPAISDATAIAIVRTHYGLQVGVKRLAGERDCNFLLDDGAGHRSVLKVFNAADDDPTRRCQCELLLHLAHSPHPCLAPRLLPTLDGRGGWTSTQEGRDHHGMLVSFLPGLSAHGRPGGAAGRVQLGQAVADLDRALGGFDHPGSARVLLWDSMHLDRLAGVIETMAAGRQRDWLHRFVDDFITAIRPRVSHFRSQFIHNDLNDSNVLRDALDPDRVSGLIDFGDVVRAPLVNEIAVLANYHLGEADPFAALGDLIEGYERTLPLHTEEVADLYDLILARLAVRLLMYQWRADLFPANRDYILRHSAGANRLLAQFIDLPRADGQAAVLAQWRSRRRTR